MDIGLSIRRSVTFVIRGLLELEGHKPLEKPVYGRDGKPMNLVEPDTIKRLRKCKRVMKKSGLLAAYGYTPPEKGESVQVLWNKHGWNPPRNGLQLRAEAVPEIESHTVVRQMKKAGAK